jgi:hypothetical protein
VPVTTCPQLWAKEVHCPLPMSPDLITQVSPRMEIGAQNDLLAVPTSA